MTTDAPALQGEMTLLEHLQELRTRLVKVSIAVVLGTALAYAFWNEVSRVIIEPYCALELFADENAIDCALRFDSPLEGFSTRIKVSMLLGLFLGGPVVFYQLWKFIVPGLTDKERRYAAPFVFVSQVLFGFGIAFAWFILPNALAALTSLGGENLRPEFRANEYVSFILTTSIAFGVVFLLPVVLIFLALLGVVTAAALRQARPYAVVGTAVLAAMITPTTDPVTMLAMMGPMVVFYEISIVFAWFFERRRRRRSAREA